MTEKLHVDDAELRELLHLVSHDLRNPLAAIVTNLEFARRLVVEEQVDQDLRESVEDSVVACDVLKRVVANFDVLAKGKDVNPTLGELGVATVVLDVVRRCRERADQASLTIDVDDGGVTAQAMLDKSLFALAIENLIANSIQHAPRNTSITVKVTEDDRGIVVTVGDAGKGVPEDHRDAAMGATSHTPKGRLGPTRYGRGLSLLSAHAASSLTGVAMELDGEDGAFVMRLIVPRGPTTTAATSG